MKLKLIFAAAVLAALTSCNMESDTLLFQETTMGFVLPDYTFSADTGNIYDFNIGQGQITYYEAGSRLLITCNATRKLSDNKYKGVLVTISKPLYQAAIEKSKVKDWKEIGEDKIIPDNIWYSGGCLNIVGRVYYNRTESFIHTFNLVVDDTESTPGALYLDLRHNAGGETEQEETVTVCMSFPIAGYIPESVKEITVGIHYRWEEEETKYIKITQ